MSENKLQASGANPRFFVEPVIRLIQLPAGMAGPSEISLDVRCFLVGVTDGLVLIDAGPEGNAAEIEKALDRVGAHWSDITDIILTHRHPDHVGALEELTSKTPGAAIWAGAADLPGIPSPVQLRPLSDGDHVRGLRVLETPGHTIGHISLLHDGEGVLFIGDAVGTISGEMSRPPAPFTADAAQAELSLRKLSELKPFRMFFSHGPEVPDPAAQLRRLLDAGA